jgi:CHASE2 domain-containing sensor protein/signal transduction histidine kinase
MSPAQARRPATRATLRQWATLTLVLALLCGALGSLGGLGRPDQTLYDAAVGLTSHAPSGEVVIIAIDDASLAQVGRWPWPRAVHAALLERLAAAKPRAIGLDLILTEPEQAGSPSPGDAALAKAIAGAGNVVLPVLAQARGEEGQRGLATATPIPELAKAAAALGHIHLEVDQDGIARSAFLREGPPDSASMPPGQGGTAQPRWPHFAVALRGLGGNPPAALPGERGHAAAGGWGRDYWLHIPYAGPPGSFTQYSYVDVLKGSVPPEKLAGKYLLVGATAAGMGDAFPTPVSGRSRPMPGIEISANILDALITGRAIVRAGPVAGALLSALPVLLLMAGLLRLTPRQGLIGAGLAVLLTLLACYMLLRAGYWVAPAAALAGLLLAYPLWSWRRLEATVEALGAEIMRLQAEPRVLPDGAPAAAPAAAGADVLEKNLLALESAGERLRAARRFVSDTLDSLPEATLVAGRDARVLLANRAAGQLWQSGTPEELRGLALEKLLAPFMLKADGAQRLSWDTLRQLAEAPAGASGARPAIELAPHEGRDLLARCAPCADAAGRNAGWIVSLSDITPLREAERSRDEVLSFLSHDMRSPQSSILALLELHELDPADNPKEAVHERIAQYANRTLELSEQFLQMARAETKEYELASVDLGLIAEEAIEEAWAAASQKQIKLKLKFDGEPVPVQADAALLRRAILNLLTNAVKYSPENTTTTIEVAIENGWAQCKVADQGYGMSEDNLQNLFKRFRRFSRPGQPKAQGAGLGMAFVKTVAERHGGRLQVQSLVGAGTTFTLQLPPGAP